MDKITIAGIKKFLYCPRWYKIHYLLKFNPSTPLKSKYPIGDAIKGCLFSNKSGSELEALYRNRIEGLITQETMVEEKASFKEMVERGLLLMNEAVKWKKSIGEILWQEQLIKYEINGVVFKGFPDILAKKDSNITLYILRVSYTDSGEREVDSDTHEFVVFKKALEAHLNVEINSLVTVSMLLRNRKERISTRSKLPIVEIKTHEVTLEPNMEKLVLQSLQIMANMIQEKYFPMNGIQDGTCSWCPYGKSITDRRFCCYDDDILEEFASTSLQRCNIDKWRDEF